MRLHFRKPALPDAPEPPSFGPWAVRHCAAGRPTVEMTREQIIPVCVDAAAVLIGAAYAYSDLLLAMFEPTPQSIEEATGLAHSVQEAFQQLASNHPAAGGVWPWEHVVPIVLGRDPGRREDDRSEEKIGRGLIETSTVYALSHREQLTSVLDLWYRSVDALPSRQVAGKQDVVRSGSYLLELFHEEQGLSDIFQEAKKARSLVGVGR